jgi:hypothetical protein
VGSPVLAPTILQVYFNRVDASSSIAVQARTARTVAVMRASIFWMVLLFMAEGFLSGLVPLRRGGRF